MNGSFRLLNRRLAGVDVVISERRLLFKLPKIHLLPQTVMDPISIVPNLPPPIGYNSIPRTNRHRFSSRISAVDELSAGYSVFDFEIAAGVTPFMVAGIEFSKRIVAQKKCMECGGSGLKKIVINIQTNCDKCRTYAMKTAAETSGVISVELQGENKNKMMVIGDGVDAAALTKSIRKKIENASLEIVQQL
ncbi:hypothetical protein L1987_73990 [Smallanthus sonchifolius]|uniref:Uncharacterized protein n=1 Tax=Smallanthus sonchifolius TaxID=185202 RepID=A0ACB9A5X1_9ASTR|nr:hypothetical protein L1987_73990 [Smallanthus sonchifolius]